MTTEPLVVRVNNDAVCRTPCAVVLPALRDVTLEGPDRETIDVGYLPEGSVVVRGKSVSRAARNVGIAIGTVSYIGLLSGTVMITASLTDEDKRSFRTAGLITTGISAAGLYWAYRLVIGARSKAEVVPYLSGSSLGAARSF
jgi:hypothetical protein